MAELVAHTFRIESAVRGYHVYRELWTPTNGEYLGTRMERDNPHDNFAVAVVRGEAIVGHIPRGVSKICWHFLNKGGTISCQITGKRQHCRAAGGMEVPCVYVFRGKPKFIARLISLFQKIQKH